MHEHKLAPLPLFLISSPIEGQEVSVHCMEEVILKGPHCACHNACYQSVYPWQTHFALEENILKTQKDKRVFIYFCFAVFKQKSKALARLHSLYWYIMACCIQRGGEAD